MNDTTLTREEVVRVLTIVSRVVAQLAIEEMRKSIRELAASYRGDNVVMLRRKGAT